MHPWLRRFGLSIGHAGCGGATSAQAERVSPPIRKDVLSAEAFSPAVSPVEELVRLVGDQAPKEEGGGDHRRDNARRRGAIRKPADPRFSPIVARRDHRRA